MNPENLNQTTSQNSSTSSQNIASSGEISDQEKMEKILRVAGFLKSGVEFFFKSNSEKKSPEKGKGKEKINVIESLDLLIKKTEQSGIVANQNYEDYDFTKEIENTMDSE